LKHRTPDYTAKATLENYATLEKTETKMVLGAAASNGE